MNIICENCQSKFKIPDAKIPAGRKASVACPKCKGKISLSGKMGAAGTKVNFVDANSNGGYDASEKPFDENMEITEQYVEDVRGRVVVEGAVDEI